MLLISVSTCSFSFSQSKDSLKKKYENSDIYTETNKKIEGDSGQVYPDSIILAPLHYINTFVKLNSPVKDFKSISIDVNIKSKLPDSYRFYISPFNASFNKMPFYCGMQTNSDGKKAHTGKKDEQIGRGGIFSRWFERDSSALKTTGYYASSDNEGDFISVRNKLKWGIGRYRFKLYKSGYVPGKAVPDSIIEKDLMFAWDDYEHSWVTMTVEDLKSHKKTEIGALAFPGKKLMLSQTFVIFLEQYGAIMNFGNKNRQLPFKTLYYKDIPQVHLLFENIMVNGKTIKPKDVKTYHNLTHHPDQSKITMPMPILSKVNYNPQSGIIDCTVGRLQSWEAAKN